MAERSRTGGEKKQKQLFGLLEERTMAPLPSDNDGGGAPRPLSPTDRALTLPEILSHIFLCALQDRDTTAAQTAWDPTARRRGLAALAVCCRVSKLWHAEAAPRLWSRPCSARLSLDEVLARAEPGGRRGYHAGLVEEGALACGWGEGLAGAEAVLGGVQFPRLRRATVYLSTGWTRIPKLVGASVTRLDLVPTVWREEEDPDDLSDPVDESYVLDQGPVLEQIPVSVLHLGISRRARSEGAVLMQIIDLGNIPQSEGCGIPGPMPGVC